MPAKKKTKAALAPSTHGAESKPALPDWLTPFRFLLVAPLIVLWPFLFGGYTLSQNVNALDPRAGYGGFYDPVTIMDPGGNLLDEPSLVLVARNLAHGRIPLLNMKNGMGAPQVESLLTGTLYALNPVLLLLPTSKPLYFDLFIVLHVYIFLTGGYFLLRWYASPAAAAAVSMLLTFSGVTFLHWNAIHYRSAVWIPLMMAGIVGVIRGERIRRHWALLLGATVACGTAGNVQEFTLDLFATGVIGACEWAGWRGRVSRFRTLVLALAGLAFGFAIASVAFLPFFLAQAEGWIFIPVGTHRSTQSYDPAFLVSWLIPRITGPYTTRFLQNAYYHPHPDYSLAGFLFVVLGAVSGWTAWRSGARHTAWLCLGPIAVIVLGLVKIVHFPIFDFVAWLPLVKDLWFVKYHSYLFVLAAIPSAIGLEQVLSADRSHARRFTLAAFAGTCGVLALAIVYLKANPNYAVPWDATAPNVREIFQKWTITGLVFVGAAAVLYFRPRYSRPLLLALVTVQCVTNLPRGNGKRKPFYEPQVDYVSVTAPAQRLLMADVANSNILFGRESFAVTDSVTNRHYRDFMLGFFVAANAGTMFQPALSKPLSDEQALALRVAGVEAVFGYPADTEYLKGFQLVDPAPRAFLVAPATFEALRSVKIRPANVADIVKRLEVDLKTLPQPTNIRVFNETVQVDLPARTSGAVLVVNQAYSPNWKLDGRAPVAMADLWPAWDLGPGSPSTASAVYWPEGLTKAMAVSAAGSVAALAFYLMAVHKENQA